MAPMTPLSSQFFLLCLYCIFTLVVGFQIARILYYRHALISFQLGFLVLCFVWGIVRIFTWSIMDSAFAYFLQIPINLQFATFSLLVIFYAHLVHKSTWERSTRKRFTIAYIVVNTILLVSSLTTLALSEQSDNDITTTKLDDAQQGIAGLVFLILVGILAWYGYRLHVAISSTAKHQMLFQVPPGLFVVTCIIILIFLSRCIYDFITISGKYSVSFESSEHHDDNTQVFIFFAYFIWEIVPATLIIGLFWRIPTTHIGGITRRGKTSLFMLPPSAVQPVPSAGIVSRLFNDPQRYDSDDETTGLIHKGTPITYTTPPKPSSYTYSIGKNTPYATSRENTPHLDSVLKGPPPTLSSVSSVSSVSSIPRPSTPSTHRPSTPSVQASNPSLHFTPHVSNNNTNIVSNNNNNNNNNSNNNNINNNINNNMENTSISIPGNA